MIVFPNLLGVIGGYQNKSYLYSFSYKNKNHLWTDDDGDPRFVTFREYLYLEPEADSFHLAQYVIFLWFKVANMSILIDDNFEKYETN
jgi:hypothetical protein